MGAPVVRRNFPHFSTAIYLIVFLTAFNLVLTCSLYLFGGPLTVHKTQPPWEFLLSASRNSLQSYELSRLSHAANLRKEIGALLDQWIEENSAAMLARWLMEQRERPQVMQESVSACTPPPKDGGIPASDNYFANRAVSPLVNRGPS
jgi:hypothetical protein